MGVFDELLDVGKDLIGGVGKAVMGNLAGGLAGSITKSILGGGDSGGSAGQTNLVALRKQAEAAGFNPLTVLQATGGAGFATAGAAPLASHDFLTGGMTTFDKLTGVESQEDVRRELENDLLRVQIDEIRRGVNAGPFMPRNVPTNGQTSIRSNGQPPGDPIDAVGNPHTPKLTMAGVPIETSPNTSDAEIFEQRYGDIAQELAGIGIALSDLWHNRSAIGLSMGIINEDAAEDNEDRYSRRRGGVTPTPSAEPTVSGGSHGRRNRRN